MSAGSIVIDLLMKTGAFETDTKRAQKRLEELKKEAQDMGKAIGLSFSGFATGAALMIKSSIDTMDAMSKLAQQSGVTVEQFSGLAYAADLAGISQDDLASSLVKLNRSMFDVFSGAEDAGKGFAALGVEVVNADGTIKDSTALMQELAGKFSAMKDGAEKTAIAVDIFGKSGAKMIPLLNGGSEGITELIAEAETLGIVLSTDTAKRAEEFNDIITRLQGSVQGLANRTSVELIPAMTDVVNTFIEIAKSEEFISTSTATVKGVVGALIGIFQTIAIVGTDVGFVFLSVGREIGAWAAQLVALGSGDLSGFTAISDAVKEDGERARAELDKFQQRIMSIGTASAAADKPYELVGPLPPVKPPPRTGGGGGGGKAATRISDFQKYMDSLQRQVEKTQELTAVEQTLLDISANRAGKLTHAQKDILLGLAQQIDASKELEEEEKSRQDSVDNLRRAQKQLADEVKGIYESSRTPLEVYTDKLARLQELYESGHLTVDVYTKATKQIGDEFVSAGQKVEESADKFSEFAKQAERNIQDALGNTLEQTLKGNFDSIGEMWIDLIQKMAAQALAAQLNQALFGGSTGGGLGGLGGFLGGLFGSSSGGVGSVGNAGFGNYADPSLFATPLATGTNYVPYDGFKATLHEGEAVVPKKYNPSAGGQGNKGMNIDMSGAVYNVGSNVSKAEVIDAVRAGNAYVEAKIRRSLAQEQAY